MEIKNTNSEEGTDEVAMELRDAPPLHYLFKIENYSLISNAKLDKYELPDFEVGGYKWRMVIYPEGNKKVNENEHISMYLKLSPSNAFTLRRDVNVSFKFFVYNHIHDKYLTIEDGKVRRFRGTKNEWGFDQLLLLNVFNDASKGYLASDCFIFGADIFVIEPPTDKGERWFVMKDLSGKSTFTWNVKIFLKPSKEYHQSELFIIGGHKWSMHFYSNGYAEQKGKSLSMCLCLEDGNALKTGEILQANFILRIRNQLDPKKDCKESVEDGQFCASWIYCGFPSMIPLSNLKEPSGGYINSDGTVIVEVEFFCLTSIKDFS